MAPRVSTVSEKNLRIFLKRYAGLMPQVVNSTPIGTQNANYVIETLKETYILTLFEKRSGVEEILETVSLHNQLGSKNFPVPAILKPSAGPAVPNLFGKRTVLQTCMEGKPIEEPTPEQCKQSGALLATFHKTAASFRLTLPQMLTQAVINEMRYKLETLLASASKGDLTLIHQTVAEEYTLQSQMPRPYLPTGIAHGEWCRANVFFDEAGENVVSVVDLWSACNESFLYDIVIALNDWGFNEQGSVLPENVNSFLEGYESVRPLKPEEERAFALEMRRSTLKSLTCALFDALFPQNPIAEKEDALQAALPWYNRLIFQQGADYGFVKFKSSYKDTVGQAHAV